MDGFRCLVTRSISIVESVCVGVCVVYDYKEHSGLSGGYGLASGVYEQKVMDLT